MIYLDYAATSPLLPVVKAEMERVLMLELGNAAALHSSGPVSYTHLRAHET